ncbi:MAG TPA: hypothetical protein VGH70_10630 [Bradyrhizobium sp.]
MRRPGMAAVAALILLSGWPAMAGRASPLVIAQADKPADPAATPPSAAPAPAPSAAPAAPGAPQEGTAKKSAISTPACSVKFLEAKVAGNLNGKKWTDFRREVCGEHETTAVFPTAIAPKYESEKDLDKARTKTCADQFTTNKATNGNGGLKWVEKDGGYYAECVSRLKEG